jgi:hypothetical protein
MASANITIGGYAARFEADGTQRTATIKEAGVSISNPDSATVYVDFTGGTVVAIDGAGGSLPLKQGYSLPVPLECLSFTFKTAGETSYPFWISE